MMRVTVADDGPDRWAAEAPDVRPVPYVPVVARPVCPVDSCRTVLEGLPMRQRLDHYLTVHVDPAR